MSNSQKPTQGNGASVREAADFFGVAPVTIRRWCARGDLPAMHAPTGRILFIPREALKLAQTGKGAA